MKLIVVVFFKVLLFNGCLTANVNRESPHQPNLSENITAASLLNEGFDFAVFESCNFADMLKFANHSRHKEFVLNVISPAKYKGYQFHIHPDPGDGQGYAEEHGTRIFLHGHSFYMNVLKDFGKSIDKLEISNVDRLNDDRTAAIHRQVNEYCSDSLTYLHLTWIGGIMMEQFVKPFSRVISFGMFLNADEMGSFALLNETFPKLQRLEIAYKSGRPSEMNASRFIESDVPHMEHLNELYIYNELCDHPAIPVIEKQLQQIMEKNPQITRVFYSSNTRTNFINVINEKLPNLEQLATWNIALDIEPLQFDHVTRFEISGPSNIEPVEKLFFPNLKAIGFSYSNGKGDNEEKNKMRESWLTFLKNNQNITQLNCFSTGRGFPEYVAALPNVEEVDIYSFADFAADEITEIIEDSENLVKLKYEYSSIIHAQGPSEVEIATFNENLGNEWNITYVPQGRSLTFEKKKN